MLAPQFPTNEVARITALHATQLLHTEPEEMFDRITRLAARVLNVPTALFTLVDTDVQWFKSRYGFRATQTPRNISFCAHALHSDEPLVVADALNDVRFADNPLVVGEPRIRFYAGFPIHSIDRMKLGTLCLIDYVPRNFGADDIQILQDLARSVEELVQQRQMATASASLLQLLRDHENIQQVTDAQRRQLEHLVYHDNLTGLPNRALFHERIHHATCRWQQQGMHAVVAVFDLDRFKSINEAYGHIGGDQALSAVARRLAENVRAQDMVARIGGDEFVLLLDGFEEGESAPTILQKILDSISAPILIGAQEISLSASIGFARYPQDASDADTLLNAANAAMRHAKESGRASVRRFHAELATATSRRLTLENQLRFAVQRNELLLHYQPKVDLRSGCIVGVEALVRWQHPERGVVSPQEFIPLAEETGFIVPIGEWVMRSACQQLQSWHALGLAPLSVAVNLSSRQFLQNDIAATVADILQSTGLAHGALELELTESVSMGNPERSADIMHRLKDMGVSLSIDDFGTGYSSLSYLKRLPIDKIKIDRSFVSDMTQSEEALAIVQAIIAMAHRLNLRVIGEGVETQKQLSFLTLNLCDEMQGYYFSKPLPADECTALFTSGRKLEIDASSQLAVAALFSCR